MSIWARLVNNLRKNNNKPKSKPEETKPDWVKRAEAECKIKSKVEFRKACRKAGIPDDWFSYTYDKSKPVCFDGNSVYYGEYGATNCSVPMAMWDVAYEQLIKYKNEYEWRQSEQPFKIDWVTIKHKWWIPGAESEEYPYVKVTTSTMTDEPDKELLADGWLDPWYDRYQGLYQYHKTVDIRTILESISIRFEKMTDDRDAMTFGFNEMYMSGTYRYPIPEDLLEEAAHVVYDFRNKQHDYRGDQVPEPLRSKILARFADRILEDEFTALSEFKETHRKALFDAIDPALSKEEQRSALADASRQAMTGCPASDNYMDSRSNTVIEENFELAYEEAGLERKRRPSVKEINDVFGNKSTV